MPEFAPVQIECKDLGDVALQFNRKTTVTHHQKEHIHSMNSACKRLVACVAIRTVQGGGDRLTLLPPDPERWTERVFEFPGRLWNATEKQYPDLAKLFSEYGFARLR
jgi:hypothetical protein